MYGYNIEMCLSEGNNEYMLQLVNWLACVVYLGVLGFECIFVCLHALLDLLVKQTHQVTLQTIRCEEYCEGKSGRTLLLSDAEQ